MTTFRQRLIRGFALAVLVPGLIFWLAIDFEIRSLRRHAAEISTEGRAESIRREAERDAWEMSHTVAERLRLVEEAGKAVSLEAALILRERSGGIPPAPPAPDPDGAIYSHSPDDGSLGVLARWAASDPEARLLYGRSRSVVAVFGDLLSRHPEVGAVYFVGARGVFRGVPWFDPRALATAPAQSIFDIRPFLRYWPESGAAASDHPVWSEPYTEAAEKGERIVTGGFPIRGAAGEIAGKLQVDVFTRQLVGFPSSSRLVPLAHLVVTRAGTPVRFEPAVPASLRRTPSKARPDDSEEARLRAEILEHGLPRGRYTIDKASWSVHAAPIEGTDWTALNFLRTDSPAPAPPVASDSDTFGWKAARRSAALLFLVLVGVSLLFINRFSARLARPLESLALAADAMREGLPARARELVPTDSPTVEVERLTRSFRQMTDEVEGQVETLSRIRDLARHGGGRQHLSDTIESVTSSVAGALGARRCVVLLYNPRERTLEARPNGFGFASSELPDIRLTLSENSLSVSVFQSGEAYVANDLRSHPLASTRMVQQFGLSNAIFLPLRNDDEALGVLVAADRDGGFTHRETEIGVALADTAGVVLRRAIALQRLEETVGELKRSQYLKDHFLQNVNHELRTPLTSILGWSEMLQEENPPAKLIETGVRQIRQSATSLLMLIDDLLDLSRIDRGAFELRREPLSAVEAARKTIDNLQSLAKTRGVELELSSSRDGTIFADPLRLQQVLWNLINNAIKFTRRGGHIRVAVEPGLDATLFTVDDDGVGIPEADLPYIFDRFRQADSSVTRQYPGMGIGLSIARTIVTLHGGEIWARSEPGRGSRFSFTIPVTKAG